MSNQGLRQASIRTVTGSTQGTIEEDWLKLADFVGLKSVHDAAGITNYNGIVKDYRERVVGQRFGSFAESSTAYAIFVSDNTVKTFNELGTFDASGPVAQILHGFQFIDYIPPEITATGNAFTTLWRGLFVGTPDGRALETASPNLPNGAAISMNLTWDTVPNEVQFALLDFTDAPAGTINRIRIVRDTRVGQKNIRMTIRAGNVNQVEVSAPIADTELSARVFVNAFSGNNQLFVNGVKATTYLVGTEATAYAFTVPLDELSYLGSSALQQANGYLSNFALWNTALTSVPSGFDTGFDDGF